MLLWRQVHLPVSKLTLQMLRQWSVVCLPLHNLHLSELDLPHLTRLAAVGRVSITEFTRNFKVPAFMS